jgi:uncharacterized membrane protein YozB (DUF420 family)
MCRFHIYVRQPDGLQLHWNTYLSPLGSRLWLAIVLIILIIATILPTLQRLGRRHDSTERTTERFWFTDCLFYVFGAFCQQGAPCHPPR